MLKRYLVFAGEFNYPQGGWDDFKGSTDSLEEARVLAAHHATAGYEWSQIVDTETGQEVKE